MMPHLGVLSKVHPRAATEVFTKDCLIYLGTCIAPVGTAKLGKPCLEYSLTMPDGSEEAGELTFGSMKMYQLAAGEEAQVSLNPHKSFDVGNGRGVSLNATVQGGTAGLIFDCRGRPLGISEEAETRLKLLKSWMTELAVYPSEALGG